MNWREAYRAVAANARGRQRNSVVPPGGPSDAVNVAEKRGAAWAFGVMADELEYAASLPPHEGADYVRRWIK